MCIGIGLISVQQLPVFIFACLLQVTLLLVDKEYGHRSHLGHVTWIIYIHIDYPFLLMLHIKFGFDWPSDFRGDDV